MDLSGYKILDPYGIRNIPLEGDFDADSLAEKLIDDWIPYIDCERKCPRADYCKYTKPSPYHSERLTDVKCGIGVNTLRNFVSCTFHILEQLSPENIEHYLDGAFYLSQFALHAEGTVGSCVDKDIIDGYGEYAPAIFGHVTRLREELNKIGILFKNIPEFLSVKGVLFLEGWTEKAFLEKLRESHSSWFLHLNLEVYDGKGNRKPKRIQMLLENYRKMGYKIYIQGDADGQQSEIFKELVRKGSVTEECTFVFKHDFESSLPPSMFLDALHQLGEIPEVGIDEFIQRVSPLDCSVVRKVQEIFGVNCEPIKLDIASVVAERLNDWNWAWWKDNEFMQTEIGQFLRFVQNIT